MCCLRVYHDSRQKRIRFRGDPRWTTSRTLTNWRIGSSSSRHESSGSQMHCQGRPLANTLPGNCGGRAQRPHHTGARGAESRKDFIHKLRIALKELNETGVWLRMIRQTNLVPAELVRELTGENQQFCRILAASINSASRSRK